ncbi:hypothetical protein ACFS6H_10325 [Terrimonas rubra]|uniref:Uncharacterized protein n=1 Tax=Terrimonas rubra TaxID=1035890 RepID=A0ABW6A791_9BACT
MRTLVIAFVVMLGFIACKKDIEYKSSFEKSNRSWKAFKASSNNNYRFVVSGTSWSSGSWTTTLKVQAGVAVERKFAYTIYAGVVMPPEGWTPAKQDEVLARINLTAAAFRQQTGKDISEYLSWTETGAMVGAHTDTPATPFLTLDQVYEKAKNDWLKKRSGTTTYFEAKNNGLISACGYVPDNCADDCFTGIGISLIEAL